ncbi:MAG: S8 family serine peptidase [Chloroflexi bacterium]|nr:S8 family serine peptidase [Chloroflexota bacterium]MBU1661456.1 S8 family serine peptidase [Chloroflexota bacterium]
MVTLAAILGTLFPGDVPQRTAAAPPGQEPLPDIEIEPELQNQLMSDGDSGYLIYFREYPDLSLAYDMNWEARGRFVVNALQQAAARTQKNVRTYLDAQGTGYTAYWIDNVIVVDSSSMNTFNGLMSFSEIAALRARRNPILYEPVESAVSTCSPDAIESNITHIGADQIWALGYTGEGIIVANIDTGVRYTHQALVNQYRGNLGGGSFDHNYNWWDPALGGSDPVPNDWHSHGSHTMGIILGDDGAGNQIGMAPGAQWIACQAFEGDDSELLECGQFMAAPWDLDQQNADSDLRPHVVNNSWGDCLQYADHWYDGVITSWHALGIYPVFSNGNAGSQCGYPYPPGLNTVGNPARAGNVTGVGSTGRDNGQYATHSNWGPTDYLDTVNPRGYPDLKPQILAPGVSIRSAYKSSDTAYGTMSGTSMSSPHVTGLVALMWSAAPCLVGDYAATETIIEETATPIPYDDGIGGGAHVPNYATGWGEINALAAVQSAMEACGGFTFGPDSIINTAPNAVVTHTFTLSNLGLADTYTLTLTGGGWPAALLTATPLAVGAGDSAQVAVRVDVPDLEGSDTFTVTAQSWGEPVDVISVTGTTQASIVAGLELTPPSQAHTGNPGDIVTHTYTLTNTGNYTDTCDLVLSGNIWVTGLVGSAAVELSAGASAQVDVEVDIPPQVASVIIASDMFTLTATSRDNGSETANATSTTFTGVNPGAGLSGNQTGAGLIGTQVSYEFTVTNAGDYTDTFGLTVTGAWTAALSADSSGELPPGGSTIVTLTVDVPPDAGDGELGLVTLTAASGLDAGVQTIATASTAAEWYKFYLMLILR